MTYSGQFQLENLLPGLDGHTLGSNLSTIDFSSVGQVLLPTGTLSVPTPVNYTIYQSGGNIIGFNATTETVDYIGTSATTVINSVLSTLTTGGEVFIAKGTYNLTGTLNVIHGSTIIRGSGWGTILALNNSVNNYIFTFTPNNGDYINGTKISDMKLQCNGANQSSAGGGIYAFSAVWCTFERLWVERPWNYGIYLYQDGLGGYGHHNTIVDCFFEKGDESNGGDGRAVYIVQSDENLVTQCTFQGNGRAAAGEPNHVFETAGLNAFIGNNFVTGATGLKMQGSHNRAIGNVFDGCQNHMMRLNGNKNLVHGNTFYNIGYNATSNTIDGVWVDNVAENTITGNVFLPISAGGCRSGVNLSSGPSTNCTVTNNIFSTTGGGSYGTGAVIPGSGTGNIIRSNQGFLTENAGTATVANGATTSVVTHGLAYTPSINDIAVTPTNSMGSATKFFVGTVTSTQFTITVNADPGATTATFVWRIKRT